MNNIPNDFIERTLVEVAESSKGQHTSKVVKETDLHGQILEHMLEVDGSLGKNQHGVFMKDKQKMRAKEHPMGNFEDNNSLNAAGIKLNKAIEYQPHTATHANMDYKEMLDRHIKILERGIEVLGMQLAKYAGLPNTNDVVKLAKQVSKDYQDAHTDSYNDDHGTIDHHKFYGDSQKGA